MRDRAGPAMLAALLALLPCPAFAGDPEPPRARALVPGIWLIPGSFEGERQPDGNTVVFQGTTGLIVMDTGRHTWHRRAILDFARERRDPVTALINSHWHLDHTSGNADIKRSFPQARLYTGTAVERMIRDVWPQSMARAQATLEAGTASRVIAEEIRGDLETRKDPQALRPDVPVTASGLQTIDGLALELNLAANAATDGDVWVYEPRSRIAVAGDLITLPVPFLDTACVAGWRAALDALAAAPFVTVVPGHGPPMNRDQFASYKAAFEEYTSCIQSADTKPACASGWLRASAALREPQAADDKDAREMAEDYVDFLRSTGGNARLCSARQPVGAPP